MRHATAASTNNKSFARTVVVAVGSAVLALAGCAADAAPEGEGATGTSADALISGGGGTLGFTCQDGVCTCSKEIEGDCDRMRINCTGDLTNLDNCLKGWLTTDCTCTTASIVKPPPRITVPRVAVGRALAAP